MKRRMLALMLASALILSTLSLSLAQTKPAQAPAGPPQVVKDMVAKAKAAIKVVSAADVKAAIDKKEKALKVNWDDEIVKGTLVAKDGKLVHPSFQPQPTGA